MKTLPWITGLSLVTLLLVSCTSNNKVNTAPPSQQVENSRSQTSQPSTSTSVPNNRLLLPKKLIPPTDPTTIKIPTGRPDPFSSLAVSLPKSPIANQRQANQPQPSKNSEETLKTRNTLGKTHKNPKTLRETSQNSKKLGETPQSDESLRAKLQAERRDRLEAQKNLQAKLQAERRDRLQAEKNLRAKLQAERQDKLPVEKTKPAPSTKLAKLARAVRVNGVMQIGGRLVAIVKEPDETISRSVSMGEYLSKGAVLVKRIELEANKEPRVILEQNGVEVIKSVSSVDGAIASLP